MATVHATLGSSQARSIAGFGLPVFDSAVAASDTVTSSGTSALATPTGALGQVWSVTVTGGNVYINFGAGTPVAAADSGWLLIDGQTRDFAVSVASEKLAIKDA